MLLRPIGLRHSSPTVWKKYVTTNQVGLTGFSSVALTEPHARTANPTPRNINPKPIFAGIDGFREPIQIHSALNNGASRMMNTAFTDCSQLAGISHPAITRSVRRSANKFIDEPACSKPDQKHAAARKQTAITPTRFFSVVVNPPNRTT